MRSIRMSSYATDICDGSLHKGKHSFGQEKMKGQYKTMSASNLSYIDKYIKQYFSESIVC